MPERTPEPKTEDEAQRIKRFLEDGAETGLKVVQAFPAGGLSGATLSQVGQLKFNTSAEELMKVASAGAGRRVAIVLEFTELKAAEQFSVQLFLNKPEANARTSIDDPAFAGSLAFFLHQGHAETLRYEFDVTQRLQKLPQVGGSLTATLVLAPLTKEPAGASLRVGSASFTVSESIVKRKS